MVSGARSSSSSGEVAAQPGDAARRHGRRRSVVGVEWDAGGVRVAAGRCRGVVGCAGLAGTGCGLSGWRRWTGSSVETDGRWLAMVYGEGGYPVRCW
eukprot:scaffold28879_cov64-Cyclotella_meneghiniana.AAC.3